MPKITERERERERESLHVHEGGRERERDVYSFLSTQLLVQKSKFEFYYSSFLRCYAVFTSNTNASKDHNAFVVGSKIECHASCRRIEVIFVLMLIMCSLLTFTIKMA
jgi:hypothetical protein